MLDNFLLPIAMLNAIAAFYNGIGATRAFDRFVKRLHDNDNLRWKALGSPAGYFWRPRYSLREWIHAIPARDRLWSGIVFSRRQFDFVDDDLPRIRRSALRFIVLCMVNAVIIILAAATD